MGAGARRERAPGRGEHRLYAPCPRTPKPEAPAGAAYLGVTSGRVRVRVRVAAVQARDGVRAVPGGLAGRAECGVVGVCVRGVVHAPAGCEIVKANAGMGRSHARKPGAWCASA
jgi:hypothetical protein